MSTEDRVRDAMRAYGETVEPSPDAWARIREHVDRPTKRARRARGWQLSLAGFAAAGLVVAVIAGLLVLRAEDDEGGGRVATPPTTDSIGGGEREPLPNFVAVKEDGSVVVITNADGRERKIADGADDVTTLAVTPDGKGVYFSRPGSEASECGPNREVVFVPVKGGKTRVIAQDAADPAVSPDGKHLAYVSYPGSSGCLSPDSLVVEKTRAKSSSGRSWALAGEFASVFAPSWAPDSRHVQLLFNDGAGITSYGVLDVNEAGSLSDARIVPLPPEVHPYGYFGESDQLLGADLTGPPEIVVLDSETGDIVRVLFQIEGNGTLLPLSAAASPLGQNVLVVAAPVGYMARGTGMYVWQEVAPTPVAFTEGVLAAAFLPL